MYVFDTVSLSRLKFFYPDVFSSMWSSLDSLVQKRELVSTREVWNEMQRGNPDPHVTRWLNDRKELIFTTPTNVELQFVAQIFQVNHFQGLIGAQQRLKGTPVADPFVIACAKARNGTVVTEEVLKPNAAKIPNVCQHFGIPCINLQNFMQYQGWSF